MGNVSANASVKLEMGLILSLSKSKEEWIEIKISDSEIIKVLPKLRKNQFKLNIECNKKFKLSIKSFNGETITEKRFSK